MYSHIEKVDKRIKLGTIDVDTEDRGVTILKTTVSAEKKTRVFPVVTSGDDTIKYVFPTKQRAAQKAIDLAKEDERIKRLIVFGSAVTMRCGMISDIDIAIDAPDISEDEFMKMARGFYREIDSEVNVIHYNDIHNKLLLKEIDEKGVNIYICENEGPQMTM